MEGRVSSSNTENSDCEIGKRQLLSSFLSANNDKQAFGSFRVPKVFHQKFGNLLPSRLMIKCKLSCWKGKYDKDSRKIYGLRRFMKFFGIRLYNLVQFDYYGKDIFKISIFKETAVECNYRTIRKNSLSTTELEDWKEEEYIIDGWSLEFEKACGLWNFNAYHNYADYFEINIISSDVDKKFRNLILKTELEILYQNWRHGTTISLRIFQQTWDIGIEWIDGTCTFAKGWSAFAKEMKLEEGDTLVLFMLDDSEQNIINICIFKQRDKIIDDRGENVGWRRSFFKVVSQPCLNEGMLVLPKLIKDMYEELLSNIKEVQIGGERCFISYDLDGGYVSNLGEIFEHFHIRPRETIIFTLDNSSVLYGRIYEEDGVEIAYSNRHLGSPFDENINWFWTVDWNTETDSKDEVGNKEESEFDLKETAQSDKMDVDVAVFPQFIIVIRTDHYDSGKMKIPAKIAHTYGNQIPGNVRLQLPTGREIHANFSLAEKCLSNLFCFIKEIRRCCASMIILNYKGEGNFLVYALNDEATEVDYLPLRTVPRAPVYHQDKTTGIGWKFLLFCVGPAFDLGEVEIPATFLQLFGKLIPHTVTFALKNGKVFNGYYSEGDRKLFGILEIIQQRFCERKDLMLFTYRGDGRFDLAIFDRSKVEKNLAETADVTEVQLEGHSSAIHNEGEDYIIHNEVPDSGNFEEHLMDIQEMNHLNAEFTVTLRRSNVNSSSHGVYIPRVITPHNRAWQAGETVTLRTINGSWTNSVVFSSGVARFSAGWNRFAKDNKLKLNQQLVFTLLEQPEGITFEVQIS